MRHMPPKKVDSFKAQGAKRETKAQNLKVLVSNFSFALYILSFTLTCYAAPCYGAKLPEKRKFFIGAQTYSIFKRYLEDEFGEVRSTQRFLLLSYGVFDWLSLDLKAGSGNIKQRPRNSDELDYASNFAGGYGFRLKFYDRNDIKMVFGFQHISVHPKSTHLGNTKNQAVLDDWQTSLLIGRDFKKVSAYLGARWSRIDYIHKELDIRKRKMSDLTKSFGLIAGFDLPLTQRIWINLEGSTLDGDGLSLSLNYKF
jgi:hypothetical protein